MPFVTPFTTIACPRCSEKPRMSPTEARRALARAVAREGVVPVATALGCSTTQALYIAKGRRRPGLRIAFAIEARYGIPARSWLDRKRRDAA